MEEVTIIKAAALPDHVNMYISIPMKLIVSKVIGRIKGKSALVMFDRYSEYCEKYNRYFGARGYYCETVGNGERAALKQPPVTRQWFVRRPLGGKVMLAQ